MLYQCIYEVVFGMCMFLRQSFDGLEMNFYFLWMRSFSVFFYLLVGNRTRLNRIFIELDRHDKISATWEDVIVSELKHLIKINMVKPGQLLRGNSFIQYFGL